VRVPTKLMAHARDAARSYGKSDPIDALAVARAALREPAPPAAHLDGPAREVRLLVDHRDNLVAERTRAINRLRWHLHELDPSWRRRPAACAGRNICVPSRTDWPLLEARSPGWPAGWSSAAATCRSRSSSWTRNSACSSEAGSDAAGAVWVRDADRGEDRR
jgi:hypothetical protein